MNNGGSPFYTMPMHLFFHSPEAAKDLKAGTLIKFVLIGPSREADEHSVTAVLLGGNETHAAVAETALRENPRTVFIGGGKIEAKKLWWESGSCIDAYGYDRPSPPTQELLLQALAQIL